MVVTEKPMTLIWDGQASGGTDPDWTNPANWVGDVAPIIGDNLSFGANGAEQITTDDNNYTVGTTFGSITFTSTGYVLGGNALDLNGGVSMAPAGTDTIDLAITLADAQSFQTTLAGGILDLDAAVHLAGNALTVSGPGVVDADAVIDGTTAASTLTEQGPGTLIIGSASSSTYAGATTVAGGDLEVNGSISSAVTITGGALTGTGSTGAVNGQTGGALYLGTAVSTLSTGSLTLAAGSDFNVLIGGAGAGQSSEDNVASGTITLAGTLNLTSVAGYVPSGGEIYTLINNSGASAHAVSGEFLAGTGFDDYSPGSPLPEGAILSTNYLDSGHTATLTYQAGSNHKSVAIVVSSTVPLTYTGTAATNPNHFILDQNDSDPEPTLEIWDNGVLVASQATSQTSVVQIGVTAGEDATLTIDYTNPFTVPVVFDGGTGTAYAHTLTLENTTYTTATFNPSTASSGTISLDSEDITYSDLSVSAGPVIIDQTPQANVVFNLPASSQGVLQGVGSGVSELVSSNSAFAGVSFKDPATALTINADGSSLIQLGARDSLFSPTSETFTGLASDAFRFASAAAIPSTANVTLTTATLDLNGLDPAINALAGNGVVTNESASASAVLSVGASGGSGAFSGSIKDGTNETAGLTKLGSGTETLSGSANNYTGPTTISAGTLQAGAADALSANSNLTDNASLDLDGFSQSIGTLSGNGIVTSSASGSITLTLGSNGGTGTFSGTIKNGSAAAVAITKSGGGVETFNSTTNVYTGSTTVSAGTLEIGDGTNFGSTGSSPISIAANADLEFDSPAQSTASALTFANGISGGSLSTVSLIQGAVLFTGSNSSFNGASRYQRRQFQARSRHRPGRSASIAITTGGQLDFGTISTLTVNSPIAISTTGYIDNSGVLGPLGAIRFAGAGDILAGTLTVTGTAMVSAYSGASGTIQGNVGGSGTLEVGSGLSTESILLLGNDAVNTTINAETTLQVGNNGTAGNLTAGADVDNGNLLFERIGTVSLGVGITGSGTLTQAGTGTLVLPSTNTYGYGGVTTVSSGVLQVDGSIADSSVNVSGSGQLTGTGTTGAVTTAAVISAFTPGDPAGPGA